MVRGNAKREENRGTGKYNDDDDVEVDVGGGCGNDDPTKRKETLVPLVALPCDGFMNARVINR